MSDLTVHKSLSDAHGGGGRKLSPSITISRTKLTVLARQLRAATSIRSGLLDIRSCKEVARKLEEAARQAEDSRPPAPEPLPVLPLVLPECAKCSDMSAIGARGEVPSLAGCDDATFEFFVRRQFEIQKPGASSVLAILMRSYDMLCTSQEICARIHCQDTSLKVFVCQLRADLQKFGLGHHIVTVRKSRKNGEGGYLIAPEHQSKFTDLLARRFPTGDDL